MGTDHYFSEEISENFSKEIMRKCNGKSDEDIEDEFDKILPKSLAEIHQQLIAFIVKAAHQNGLKEKHCFARKGESTLYALVEYSN